jgi:hypothetical protein
MAEWLVGSHEAYKVPHGEVLKHTKYSLCLTEDPSGERLVFW